MNIVVILDKEKGPSSQEAVTSVKRAFKVRKAGHAGTLDPLATGVLLVCLNEATKITRFIADMKKEYLFTAKLGENTDTFDAEGSVISHRPFEEVTLESLSAVLGGFTGEIEQTPPMYSAIKKNGKPLYSLARQGIEVEREKRIVAVTKLDIVDFFPPFISFRVVCSKGTYIRSLCNDIGEALGTGAHVLSLRRLRVGAFTIENSALIGELPLKTSALVSLDDALSHLPSVQLEPSLYRKVQNGNAVPFPPELRNVLNGMPNRAYFRMIGPDGRLFGIGNFKQGMLGVERLLSL